MIKCTLAGLDIQTEERLVETVEEVGAFMLESGYPEKWIDLDSYDNFNSNWEIRFPNEYKAMYVSRV